jgi:uncharacterized BrkB/YihY/UPF0761 family membrane protein
MRSTPRPWWKVRLTAIVLTVGVAVFNSGVVRAAPDRPRLLGAVMILLLWFYISGLVILVGAEMNVEIEHAGKAGPRRRIGDRTFAGVERRQHAQ